LRRIARRWPLLAVMIEQVIDKCADLKEAIEPRFICRCQASQSNASPPPWDFTGVKKISAPINRWFVIGIIWKIAISSPSTAR
jgi:hypothetical protein